MVLCGSQSLLSTQTIEPAFYACLFTCPYLWILEHLLCAGYITCLLCMSYCLSIFVVKHSLYAGGSILLSCGSYSLFLEPSLYEGFITFILLMSYNSSIFVNFQSLRSTQVVKYWFYVDLRPLLYADDRTCILRMSYYLPFFMDLRAFAIRRLYNVLTMHVLCMSYCLSIFVVKHLLYAGGSILLSCGS